MARGKDIMSCERRRLRAIGSTVTSPDSCPCPKCRDHPLTPAETDAALEHVSDADAARYAAGALRIIGYELCDECEVWVPTFVDPAPRSH